jgi:hypothetical protein
VTSLTRDDLLPYLGQRVRVVLHADAVGRVALPQDEPIMRFLPPPDAVVLIDEGGHEYRYLVTDFVGVEDARRACDVCGPDSRYNNTSLTNDEPERRLCVEHYRGWAREQPPPVMECPECDRTPAFFSPGDRTYACASCHQKRGGLTGLGVEVRVMTATCRAADIDSPDHDWKQIRGQWSCRNCHVKVRTKPKYADDVRRW